MGPLLSLWTQSTRVPIHRERICYSSLATDTCTTRNVAYRVPLPTPRFPARPSRPPSERLHLWKKVMKVHQDRQLRICTHAQAQIQCRYAYLPKIGRHQNQTRSAGRSSPPVVDLYRQTHLARSELLRTPRHTSIYQGQFYP